VTTIQWTVNLHLKRTLFRSDLAKPTPTLAFLRSKRILHNRTTKDRRKTVTNATTAPSHKTTNWPAIVTNPQFHWHVAEIACSIKLHRVHEKTVPLYTLP